MRIRRDNFWTLLPLRSNLFHTSGATYDEFTYSNLSTICFVQSEAFEQICSETQAAIIILTKGADGAVVRCGSTQFDVAAAQADPLVDTVGAGDTFMGTLLVEISKTGLSASKLGSIAKDELARIVTRAAKAAALNCQSAGCNPPYEQEL